MSKPTINIREWWPLAAAMVALIVATSYAVSRGSQAADGIQKANELGANLTDAAQMVRESTIAQEEAQSLTDRRRDLQQRMADARQPSLVQAELMKSAKEVGLTLREIQPINNRAAGKSQSDAPPQYRVLMQGTYQQMAEYLHKCASQRLPARVVALDLRSLRQDGHETARLAADITVEPYQPAVPAAKPQDPL